MSALTELIKVDLRETFDKRKFKQDKKAQTFLAYAIGFGILFLFISFLYNLIYVNAFKLLGCEAYVPIIFFAAFSSILSLTTSLFKIKAIFIGKDYDMLSAMPIKKRDILTAKLFSLYIVELLYSAFVMIPNAIVVLIAYGSPLSALVSLCLMVFAPALPMIVAALFSLFVTLIADRYKFGNIINIIFYLLLFAGIIGLSFTMSFSSMQNPDDETAALQVYYNLYNVLKWVNPSLVLVELSYEANNILYFLLFVGGSILVVFLVILFISKLFDTVHTVINTYKSNTVYVKKELAVKGQFSTLFRAECKKYFGSKYYFINTVASGVMAIIFAVMAGVSLSKFSPLGLGEDVLANVKPYAYFATGLIIFGVGIQTPAAISISIEGNSFWIIKVSPIDYRKYIFAKVLLSTLVLGVCSIISSTIFVVLVGITNVFNIITIYLLPVLFIFLSSMLGIFINLKRYKFDWKNEMECVKHSSASYIALFIDWGITFVLFGSMVALSFVSHIAAQIVGFGVVILFIIILGMHLNKNADNLIERIDV